MSDLSPRLPLPADADRVEARRELGRRRKVIVVTFGLLLLVAAVALFAIGLRDATEFFRNADEAIAARDELGERRFRLQGRVVPSSVTIDGGVTTFEVLHNCASVSVRHTANPPVLFQSPWIPVVLLGHWEEGDVVTVAGRDTHYFLSDDMVVKHTNEYAAANEDRLPAPTEAPEGFLDDCPFEVPRL